MPKHRMVCRRDARVRMGCAMRVSPRACLLSRTSQTFTLSLNHNARRGNKEVKEMKEMNVDPRS